MAYEVQPIIFCKLPLQEELCHLLVSIDHKDKKDSNLKLDYQWQYQKTRALVLNDKNLLASPMVRNLHYIHVVCKRDYYASGCLTKLLLKTRLKVEVVSKLTLDIYEMCLIYHFTTKLSPIWNRVEKMFVNGKYFLWNRGQLGAVELKCIISDDKLLLYVLPLRLWLTKVELLAFDLPVSILEHSVSENFYKDLSHESLWVHVLPSFMRGRVMYITNYIPENCPFKNYQEISLHWKNTYGFRLAEEGSATAYIGVNFFGPLDYTYPLECVRRGMRTAINSDPKLVLSFADSIQRMASVICGDELKLINLGVPILPHFMAEPESKWDEKNLLTIEKHLLENFLHPVEGNKLIQGKEKIQISFQTLVEPNFKSIISARKPAIIFSGNEIEGLHRVGKLHKVNRPSLRTFLKKNSIEYRQRDKKEILLSKAEMILTQLKK